MDHPRLPVELFRQIIRIANVPTEDESQGPRLARMVALIDTCRRFRDEAERILYRRLDTVQFWFDDRFREVFPDVILMYGDEWEEWFLAKCSSLLATIGNCQRLANYVVEFAIDLEPEEDLAPVYWSNFRLALSRLRNLKILEFTYGNNYTWKPIQSSLLSAPFTLTNLRWQRLQDSSEFLEQFFDQQPGITTLELSHSDATFFDLAPAYLLPNLRDITASYDAFLWIAPGRKVTSVTWYINKSFSNWKRLRDENVAPEDDNMLAEAFAYVEKLWLADPPKQTVFESLVPFLPRLRFLDLEGIRRDEDSLIIQIPRLEHLKIRLARRMKIPENSTNQNALFIIENQEKYISNLFAHIYSLRIVDVQEDEDWYLRFSRGRVDQPKRVPKTESNFKSGKAGSKDNVNNDNEEDKDGQEMGKEMEDGGEEMEGQDSDDRAGDRRPLPRNRRSISAAIYEN